MEKTFRIFDFNIYNQASKEDDSPKNSSGSEDELMEEKRVYKDKTKFFIQMFAINEEGKTSSILATDFKPFFYVKVAEHWDIGLKNAFIEHIKQKMGKFYDETIHSCIIVKRKQLYGFDAGKKYKFLKIEFQNTNAFNKAKNLWYTPYSTNGVERTLLKNGLRFGNTDVLLYESHIPPLLRAFHVKEISPSGWIALPNKKCVEIKGNDKKTICDYEFVISYKDIVPLNDIEKPVPFKKCSFDIEASSSHGDFPIPIKTYKKLATNIIDIFQTQGLEEEEDTGKKEIILRKILSYAFGFSSENVLHKVDLVYPIEPPTKKEFEQSLEKWLKTSINKTQQLVACSSIENYFEKVIKTSHQGNEEAGVGDDDEDEDGNGLQFIPRKKFQPKMNRNTQSSTILDILEDDELKREEKITILNNTLNSHFPKVEGDKVTFIGTTFMRYGEQEPYLNHCIVLNTCSKLPIENSVLESYTTEKEVLLAWCELMRRENPDIVIGYNIFGFDYEFMFRRAEENDCVEEFLKLSRNKDEICGTKEKGSYKNGVKYKIEETSIQIASGQHDLHYIKMNGRLQIDLYNFYRREENLTSYKLDYVSGYFIGDYVKKIELVGECLRNPPEQNPEVSKIYSGNLMGLLEGSYIHFEEIGHSIDYYDSGAKFKVISVDKVAGVFQVVGTITPDFSKKVRWCLAKDDVTPKDIFEMTNGTADDRAVIAKYCIQDCNLVHYLMNKSDILTGFIEMSKICSVPMSFLVLRGQGIKLTSFIAKKCREKDTLVPTIDKGSMDDGYEGAIVLDPKCDLYLDNPVACVDYASLYPSSIISENLSHDSKVWTKEYDLAGNLMCETGEKMVGIDENGNPVDCYLYDNLDGYEYVTVEYDTYQYVRKKPGASAEKVKCGKKICRFAQFPEGKAIMPSILEELLVARKTTRKLIPQQTDEFMKNVLDKRQLAYKVTANSLYGQCGAKTSSFYEMDVAASTTAIGRMLLTYAKKIIEECYGDSVCETKNYGPVLTKAEYIYGDSVASYTPVYNRFKGGSMDILTIEELAEKYGNGLWIQCLEPGKEEKEVCEFGDFNVETWTDKGWTRLFRVIRHALAPHKKMIRILTHTGLVDVTDDHSLLLKSGEEISPKEVKYGTELLHRPCNATMKSCEWLKELPYFKKCYKNKLKIFKEWCDNILARDLHYYSYHTLDGNSNYRVSIDSQEQELLHIIYFTATVIFGFVATIDITELDKNIQQFIEINIFDNSNKSKTKQMLIENPNAIKKIQEISYEGFVYDLTTENHHFAAGIGNLIVHNTDSVFFTFNLQTPQGEPIRGKKALEITIELAQEAGHLASSFLKKPHDLEYEKTFMPFCLLSKKRYVGMLYETDVNKGKRKEMGIVLKRRDNAPIVKEVYGGIIDILMKKQNIPEAIDFLNGCLKRLADGEYPMDKLIITKSLRSDYKNPLAIAHKVLADRITARDPGNKPGSGDRIPYVYINHPLALSKTKKILQGDKIETPGFILENKLKIDYSFYITNQIMKPIQQLFALVLEKIWLLQKKAGKASKFKREIEDVSKKYSNEDKYDDEDLHKKIEKMRNKEIKTLLFDPYLRETNNVKQGNQSLMKFFGKKD
jgi:DNA polymerase elongation subunit (family B)